MLQNINYDNNDDHNNEITVITINRNMSNIVFIFDMFLILNSDSLVR